MQIHYTCQCDSCKIVRANHMAEMTRQRNTVYGSRDDWFRDNLKAWEVLRNSLCRRDQ